MTSVYWMSFVDASKPEGERFLGVALVDAESIEDALTRSKETGCNPGGEVQIVEIPTEYIADGQRLALGAAPRNTLMSRERLRELGLTDQEEDQ